MDIYHADGFGWAASAAQINASALALVGAGCSAVGADPADAGGKSVTFPSARAGFFPCANPGTSYVIHLWLNGGGNVSVARRIFELTDAGGSSHFNINAPFGASANLQFRLGTTVLYTASSSNSWSHYIIEVTEDAMNGSIRIVRDGGQVYFDDELDTSRGFTIDRVRYGSHTTGGGSTVTFAHPVVSSELIGASAVVEYFPVTSDETPNEMTRNTGDSDYEALDDVPNDGDTTYLLTEDAEDRTTHKATVSGLDGRQIFAAQVHTTSRLETESGDRLALRLAGEESVVGSIDDSEYTGRGGSWYDELPAATPLTEASLTDAAIQVEHLAPEE